VKRGVLEITGRMFGLRFDKVDAPVWHAEVDAYDAREDERLVGMITDRDITTRVVAESAVPETTSVGDVYSRDLISVEPNSDLDEALRLMARHQVRRLPVVENDRLVGMVAQADIALKESERTGELVGAISEPSEEERK